MKYFKELQEGVYDPNIFKAFFLAGGPGSGKSYVVKKTTKMFGMRVVNSDDVFEKLVKSAGMSMDMRNYTKAQEKSRDELRAIAKRVTKAREKNYVEGRLGLIIDGTGKDYDKIEKQMRELQQLGYESHMIFVNTSLEVALQRNEERARTLPRNIVEQSWSDVQKNLAFFQGLFGGSNFLIVDNSKFLTEKEATKKFKMLMEKGLKKFLKKKIKNPIAKQWIKRQKAVKKLDLKGMLKQ